jgi:hypothetical protein
MTRPAQNVCAEQTLIIIIIIDGLFTLLSQMRFELQSVYKVEKVKKKKYFTYCTYG